MNDVVAIIEAAYRVDLDPHAWLVGVVEAVRPHLGTGSGTIAYEYDASDVSQMRVTDIALDGMPALVTAEQLVQIVETADPNYVRSTWRSVPCALASTTPGVEQQPGWVQLQAMGIADVFAVNGVDPSGIGCWVGTWLPKRIRLSERTRLKWGRIAAHLATGLRLRRRLGTHDKDRLSGADAVLGARGKVEHAEGEAMEKEARKALRDAALALDRARGSLRRRDPNLAIAEWKGLVEARWSLIDHFDSDGRRYLVARKNEPTSASFNMLSPRERQVVSYASFGHSNKLIAYELGISHSTVRVLIARAVAKLGVKSRDELIGLVARALESERRKLT